MKSIKVCEFSRSRSFHYDLILQDQASGERSQDQWSSGLNIKIEIMVFSEITGFGNYCSLRPETLQMQTTCEVNKGV